MISALLSTILFSAIELVGVKAVNLEAVSSFDAYNVRLGDPMTLTVDFIGEANFDTLHPPPLSKYVNKNEWKVDDKSAKTSTYQNARRLEYRVRPVKDGIVYFPRLEFSCPSDNGSKIVFSTASLPVSVRASTQVVLSGLEDDVMTMPRPDGISLEAPDELSKDDKFKWRKACVTLDPELFKVFSFPRAKLNEAACRIIKGEWAKALSIYSKIEWIVGQTPEIERGIKAALALKFDDPNAVLPVWREVGRPILKYSWQGRVAIAVGALLSVLLVFYLAGKLVRLLALIAVCVALPSSADVFSEMERQIQQMHEEMSRSFGGMPGFVNESSSRATRFDWSNAKLSVKLPSNVAAGVPFDLELKIECPVNVDLGRMNLAVSPERSLKFVGEAKMHEPVITSGKSTNKVQRIIVPLLYLAPYEGDFSVELTGTATVSVKTSANSFFSVRRTGSSFKLKSGSIPLQVAPLPAEGMMADFNGIAGQIQLIQGYSPQKTVRTNDVVVVYYDMQIDGFVPKGAIEDCVANTKSHYKWRRFFIADGKDELPPFKLAYFDTLSQSYKYAQTAPIKLRYVADEPIDAAKESKAVDVNKTEGNLTRLYFAPDEKSPVIGHTSSPVDKLQVTHTYLDWLRVDDGKQAGWMKCK